MEALGAFESGQFGLDFLSRFGQASRRWVALHDLVVSDESVADLGAAYADPDPEEGRPTADQAVTLARLAVVSHPAGGPRRVVALVRLIGALLQRAGERGTAADNTAAIAATREAVALAGPGPDAPILKGVALNSLAHGLGQRYELTGDITALREAVDAARQAARELPAGRLARASALTHLGYFIMESYDGDRAVVDEAVAAPQEALALDSAGPELGRTLSVLGAALHLRFRTDGARSDLDDAVTLSRQAVDAVDADDPSLPDWLGNLANALRLRYERLGEPPDLDEAVTASTRAADATATGHADRPRVCHHLAEVLVARYERRGDPADLDAALDAAREPPAARRPPRWEPSAAPR